jgi:hypothetical protein
MHFRPVPVRVEGVEDIVEVVVGGDTTIARRGDGAILLWGLEPCLPG